MAVIETWLHQDLQEPVKVNHLDGNLFSNNGNGNRIGVVLTNNGEALASISGTVSGYVVTADGSTVPCTGSKSGNRASILIPAAAYQPGSIFITVFVTDGTTVTTIGAVSTTVMRSRTNAQVDPGSAVTDWTQTINAAMQSVETAAANLGGIVAVPYASITFPVPLGKYTYYNNNLYRCITPIASSESFTAAHWTQVRLGDDVSDLKSATKDTGYRAVTDTLDTWVPFHCIAGDVVTVKTAGGENFTTTRVEFKRANGTTDYFSLSSSRNTRDITIGTGEEFFEAHIKYGTAQKVYIINNSSYYNWHKPLDETNAKVNGIDDNVSSLLEDATGQDEKITMKFTGVSGSIGSDGSLTTNDSYVRTEMLHFNFPFTLNFEYASGQMAYAVYDMNGVFSSRSGYGTTIKSCEIDTTHKYVFSWYVGSAATTTPTFNGKVAFKTVDIDKQNMLDNLLFLYNNFSNVFDSASMGSAQSGYIDKDGDVASGSGYTYYAVSLTEGIYAITGVWYKNVRPWIHVQSGIVTDAEETNGTDTVVVKTYVKYFTGGTLYINNGNVAGVVANLGILDSDWYYNNITIKKELTLKGKSVIGFGDSIMAGDGNNGFGIIDIISNAYKMNGTDYSLGGATITYDPTYTSVRKNITSQVEEAVSDLQTAPDFILFDGLTNDISTSRVIGEISDGYSATLDKETFCGAFEYILKTIKTAFPSTKIIYIRPHRMGSRSIENQDAFGDKASEICSKWSTPVCDIYNKGGLNTFLPSMYQYTNPTESQPLGDRTHPNQTGYDLFYIPLIVSIMNSLV